MKRAHLYIFILTLLVSASLNSQSLGSTGVGTLNPTHTLHVILDPANPNPDPIKIEGLRQMNATDTVFLVTNPTQGILQYITKQDLINIVGSTNTDDQNITSFILNNDSTFTIAIEDGNTQSISFKSLFDNTDEQTLSIIGDSLEISNGNRILFIDNDSTNEKLDTGFIHNDTILALVEGNDTTNVDLTPLIDSAEWIDGSRVNRTVGQIYARKTLQNNNIVTITNNGNLGLGTDIVNNRLHLSSANVITGILLENSITNSHTYRISTNSQNATFGTSGFGIWDQTSSNYPLFISNNNNYTGLNTVSPTNQLHIVSNANPLRLEGLVQMNATDTVFLVTNPTQGVLQYITKQGLIDLVNTDEQTLSIIGDSLEISNGNRILFIDNDSTNEKLDTGFIHNDTTLALVEGSDTTNVDLTPLIDSAEWIDGSRVNRTVGQIYARKALQNNNIVTVTNNGNLGLGTDIPSELLELQGGGIQLNDTHGIGFNSDIPRFGNTFTDAARIYYDNHFFAPNVDALVIEKTDGNEINPDLGNSGIAFTMKGNDNIRETPMVIKGNNRVGINTLFPTDALQVNGNVRIGLLTNANKGIPAWGDRLYFSGGGVTGTPHNGDNSDVIYFARYNPAFDTSELRLILGDNGPSDGDAFVIGAALSGTNSWNQSVRIQANGNVYIGNISAIPIFPTNKLHVVSTANPLRLEGVQEGQSTDSILSINSTGIVRKLDYNDFLPAGMVQAFAMPTAPTGWLVADGREVNRADYPRLFAAIGTMYGVGNGTTTFNLPDYRGYFLRGQDNGSANDPDAATRTDRGDGTTGDNVGTKQTDALQNITGDFGNIIYQNNHLTTHANGAFTATGPYGVIQSPTSINTNANTGEGITFDASRVARTSTETRPKNISVYYCIKY